MCISYRIFTAEISRFILILRTIKINLRSLVFSELLLIRAISSRCPRSILMPSFAQIADNAVVIRSQSICEGRQTENAITRSREGNAGSLRSRFNPNARHASRLVIDTNVAESSRSRALARRTSMNPRKSPASRMRRHAFRQSAVTPSIVHSQSIQYNRTPESIRVIFFFFYDTHTHTHARTHVRA